MEDLSISVVLPSYHRLEQLAATVTAYLRQDPDEVIVVLDGPHPEFDADSEPFTDGRVRTVELPENRGLALARIVGLGHAHGDVILLGDDDSVPCPGLIEGHKRVHAEQPGTTVLGYMPVQLSGERRPDDGAALAYSRSYERAVTEWERDPDSVVTGLWGGNVSLPADVYRRAEAYKPSIRLPYFEDLDLGMRLAQLGVRAVFDRTLLAEHHQHQTFDGLVRSLAAQGVSCAMLAERWQGVPANIERWLNAPTFRICWWLTSWMRDDHFVLGAKLAFRALGAIHWWGAQDLVLDITGRRTIVGAYRRASNDPSLRSGPPNAA